MIKHLYFKQFNSAEVKIKWFQELLCITNNAIKHQSFVYIQLNDETVLFQTTQFIIKHIFVLNLNVKYTVKMSNSSIWPIDRTLSGVTTPYTWEWCQRRGTLHFRKLHHYWSLTIRLFSVISRTLVVGSVTLCRDAVGVFCSPSWLGQIMSKIKYSNFNSLWYRKSCLLEINQLRVQLTGVVPNCWLIAKVINSWMKRW